MFLSALLATSALQARTPGEFELCVVIPPDGNSRAADGSLGPCNDTGCADRGGECAIDEQALAFDECKCY